MLMDGYVIALNLIYTNKIGDENTIRFQFNDCSGGDGDDDVV